MYLRLSIGLNILFFGVLVIYGTQSRAASKAEDCTTTGSLQTSEQAPDTSALDVSANSEPALTQEEDTAFAEEQNDEAQIPGNNAESAAVSEDAEVGLSLEKISIMVLNGSGFSGIAGRLEDKLESLGFTDVVAGNASEWGYEVSEVRFEPANRDKAELVVAALGSDFEWSIQDEPYGNQIADVVLVLGDQFNVDSL